MDSLRRPQEPETGLYTDDELARVAARLENPTYVRLRCALIPKAEIAANRAAGREPARVSEHMGWAAKWNRVFHDTMEQLVLRERL